MDQHDRVDYVGQAKFGYNATTHLATKKSPFKMIYRVEPLQLVDLVLKGVQSILKFNQDGEDLAKKHKQIIEKTKLLLGKI